MTALIVNPRELRDEAAVLAHVRTWLAGEASKGPLSETEAFDQKWGETTSEDRAILRALIEEGSHQVKESSIKRRLRGLQGMSQQPSEVLRGRRPVLSQANLVRFERNIYDGDEMSLHPAWEWHVRHAVSRDLGSAQ